MGGGLAGWPARQHPDLIDLRSIDTLRPVVLGLLALNGAICAVVSALMLPLYIGAVPFPISAVIAGAVNVALVWAAAQWTASPRLAGLPLWTWLLTVMVLMLGGPGGDVVFGGPGWQALAVILLVGLGAGPAAWFLARRGPDGP